MFTLPQVIGTSSSPKGGCGAISDLPPMQTLPINPLSQPMFTLQGWTQPGAQGAQTAAALTQHLCLRWALLLGPVLGTPALYTS